MIELGWILKKRAYWCSIFSIALLALLFISWKLILEEAYKQRMSLKSSYSDYVEQSEKQETGASVSRSLKAATHDVSEIQQKLSFLSESRNSAEIVPHVVKLLDKIAMKHSVKLKGVKPLVPEVVLMLEERPFDITISGDYKKIFEWVAEAEVALDPMAIKSFQISPSRANEGVDMLVRVVSYRSPGGTR